METPEALPDDYAVCIAGHGSRDKDGIEEFLTLSSKFKEREPNRIVECGVLEFAKPTIDEAIEKCAQDGIKNIVSWTYYCPGCNSNFSESIICPKCGNKLKRKKLKK